MAVSDYLSNAQTPASGSLQGTLRGVSAYLPSGQKKGELKTSEGLYGLAQQQGGTIADAADSIVNPQKDLLGRVADIGKTALSGTIKTLQLSSNVVAGIIDPNKTIGEAIKAGETPSDVIFKGLAQPKTFLGKAALFTTKLATDVLLDPLTYVTFGTGGALFGVRAASKLGEDVVLNKAGQALLQKGLKKGLEGGLTEEFVKNSMLNLIKKNPAMAKQFVDQGGIKFFGKTLLSGQRIGHIVENIPGMSKLDDVTKGIRNVVGSLFSRDIDPKFGKLPQEFIDYRQELMDAGMVKQGEALDNAFNIAYANKLTQQERSLITGSLDLQGVKMGDPRLENARQLIRQTLGIARKEEIKAGILANRPKILESNIKQIKIMIDNLTNQRSGMIIEEEINQGLAKLIANQQKLQLEDIKGLSDIPGLGKNTLLDLQKVGVKTLEDIVDKDKVGGFVNDIFDPFLKLRKALPGNQAENVAKISEDFVRENQVVKDLIPSQITFKTQEEGIQKLNGIVKNLNKAKDQSTMEFLRSKQIYENYVPHMLVDEEVKNIPFKPGQTKTTLPFAKRRTVDGMIKDIKDDHGTLKFDDDIIRTVAIRTVASARALTAHEFFTGVAKKFGALANEASSNYVEVAAKELKGWKFHPAIAKQIDAFQQAFISDEATNALLKSFDKAQNIWKASVSSIFPSFHGRNAISNVFLNYLDIGSNSLNPGRHAMASQLLYDNYQFNKLSRLAYGTGKAAEDAKAQLAELMGKKVLTDSFGNPYTFGELHRIIKNNRVAFGNDFLGMMDIGETVTEQVGKIGMKGTEKVKSALKGVNPLSSQFIGYKAGREVGNTIEQQARLVNFISNLRATGDPLLAAQRTKMFLFDYQNLSAFEKNVMRRLVPFYTFTRKNLEAQVKTLFTAPGRIGAEVHALTTIGDVFLGGEGLTQEEKNALPDWIKQGISFVGKKSGAQVQIFGSFQTPFEQPFSAFQPSNLLSSITPILKVPLEQTSGYSFFYGKPLSEVDNATAFKFAPEAIKQFIGFQKIEGKTKEGKPFTYYVSLHPERMNLLVSLPPTSRVISTLKQVTNEDVTAGYRTLQFLIGVKPYAFDLDREAQKREIEQRKKLEDLLNKAGVIYKFQITGVPKKK